MVTMPWDSIEIATAFIQGAARLGEKIFLWKNVKDA